MANEQLRDLELMQPRQLLQFSFAVTSAGGEMHRVLTFAANLGDDALELLRPSVIAYLLMVTLWNMLECQEPGGKHMILIRKRAKWSAGCGYHSDN